MQTSTGTMRLTLGLAILLACATGCSQLLKTPAPTPTTIPTPPVDVPAAVVAARSAALDFLRALYPGQAPPEGLHWTVRTPSPMDIPAVSFYEFVSDGWLLAVNEVAISPQETLFEMALNNSDTGFSWTGKLDGEQKVLESNLAVSIEALVVRDLVLVHVRERYPADAPHMEVVWIGERTTPEGAEGHESFLFASDEWSMVVQYDVERPDQTHYQTELARNDEAFVWRGWVDAEGTVHELGPAAQ